MPVTAPVTSPIAWRDWRRWPGAVMSAWRGSLRFRTILMTVLLTAAAVVVACTWTALAIQNDLFDSRREESLVDARRGVALAQETFDSAEVGGDRAALARLMITVRQDIVQRASTQMLGVFRIDDQPSPIAPQGFATGGLGEDLLSDGLRERVRTAPDSQWWQSVELSTDSGMVAGIVVGQQLYVPGAGYYEVYLAYDFADAAETLAFVQRTLWVTGIALVLIVAAISWFVLRAVAIPIIEAAETSARLAAGDLEVRLPVQGEDELATLGVSFNAMADSIEAQIKELGELSLVQQRFVSDVSHELRTPLTTIRLAADILNDHRSEFDPPTARAAELLHDQVARFEVLLSDLLEISRYDAGSVQLELEPTNLAALAEDVAEAMGQLAAQHGSRLRFVAPGGYSPVEMDPRRVRRVLRNLLGNAIEHGEGRPIVITVDSDERAVAVGVRDYGMGMTQEEAEQVFDRFWRADPSRRRTIGGTGLGLSIALGDAHLHGGRLQVWSEPGRGTNFVLTLPREGGQLDGGSPLPAEPTDESLPDALGATEPIEMPQRGELA